VSFVEVDRMNGALVDPRLGRMTVDEWWCEWWPTVTNLRISTRSRDAQFYRTHVKPVFGDTPLAKLDHTALRMWVARLGSPSGSIGQGADCTNTKLRSISSEASADAPRCSRTPSSDSDRTSKLEATSEP